MQTQNIKTVNTVYECQPKQTWRRKVLTDNKGGFLVTITSVHQQVITISNVYEPNN